MSSQENHGHHGHEAHGHGHHSGHGHPPHEHEEKELKVLVSYNGMDAKIPFKYEETLGVLRERAVASFTIQGQQPHTLSLYTVAGVEFTPDRDQQTIRQAGIEKNQKLLLRPGVVRGGRE